MDTKKIVVGIVAVIIVAVALYGTAQKYGEGRVEAALIVENGGSTVRDARIAEGSTVFDLMIACGISFEEEGGFVTSINGISQDTEAGCYWVYYINGDFAPVGAGDYVVQEGDEITWKLECF